jgi:hypothetical protein
MAFDFLFHGLYQRLMKIVVLTIVGAWATAHLLFFLGAVVAVALAHH